VVVHDPVVSVVLTTKDRPELAERAMVSVLRQTLDELELIVVDDGSSVAVPLIADRRVVHIRHDESIGVCASRNAGLARARGRWVMFLDDDDELLPDMLHRSVEAAGESALPRPVAVLSAIQVVDDAGADVTVRYPATQSRGRHWFLEPLEQGTNLRYDAHNTLVAPTDVVLAIGGWDQDLRSWEHSDFFLRLNAVCSLQGIDDVTYRLRDHVGVRRSRDLTGRAEAMERTVDRHRATFRQHRRRYAHFVATAGITYLRAGEWGNAVRCTGKAVLIDPRRGRSWIQLGQALLGPRVRRAYERRWRGTGDGSD
jgi:glycosyltransferase involved in cell wall biosynthesis